MSKYHCHHQHQGHQHQVSNHMTFKIILNTFLGKVELSNLKLIAETTSIAPPSRLNTTKYKRLFTYCGEI